jgi:23S rRNA (uracil1939-C5)-methyltransferase
MNALCRHFGVCGGCAFQDLSPEDYRALKHGGIETVLARHGIGARVAPLVTIAPRTRRRASLKAAKQDGEVIIGFHAARSHAVVDMRECFVLTPSLLSLVAGLREMLHRLLKTGEQAEIEMTATDSGVDLSLALPARNFARDVTFLAEWANGQNVARIMVNGDVAVQLSKPRVRVGETDVLLPAAAFLQPSRESERILQSIVLDAVKGARRVADLFAGCGTFTLVLAQNAAVHAVDSDAGALEALAVAARKTKGLKPVAVEPRDLFKRPLRLEELNAFDAVVLDPPRAGARAQMEMMGGSRLPRVVYVSCNPETFARDAAILTQVGFRLAEVKPVDQFLWSKHIELAGTFERQPGWSRRQKN